MIDLKKKISICLFLILLAVCGTGYRVYLDNRSLPTDPIDSVDIKDSEETAESMHVADAGKYYLILEGDRFLSMLPIKKRSVMRSRSATDLFLRNGADSCQGEFLFPQMRNYMNFLKIILLKSSFIICLFEPDVIK